MELCWKIRYLDRANCVFKDRYLFLEAEDLHKAATWWPPGFVPCIPGRRQRLLRSCRFALGFDNVVALRLASQESLQRLLTAAEQRAGSISDGIRFSGEPRRNPG